MELKQLNESSEVSTIKHLAYCDVTNQYYVTKEGMSMKGR